LALIFHQLAIFLPRFFFKKKREKIGRKKSANSLLGGTIKSTPWLKGNIALAIFLLTVKRWNFIIKIATILNQING